MIRVIYSVVYAILLIWTYKYEIIHFWDYMRFGGDVVLLPTVILLLAVSILAVLLPNTKDTTGYIVTVLHYFYFIPSFVYAAYNDVHVDYIISLTIVVACVYVGTRAKFRMVVPFGVDRKTAISLILFFVIFSLVIGVSFGGGRNFNLDLESVYEYRMDAMESMPLIFNYMYSNVSNVLIPSLICMGMHYRSKLLVYAGLVSGVLMFGMTQHKSVLFISFFIVVMYYIFWRMRDVESFGLLPISLLGLCVLEIGFNIYFAESREVGDITSYIVRRTLLVPPMLDVAWIEFFSDNQKYFWSTSKLSLGLTQNPYNSILAPFLVGVEVFSDPSLAANTGVIGSGYSNAGLFGVIIYSTICALVIIYLNNAGSIKGHPFVAAISVPTVLLAMNTTDMTTAILSHGLLLLLILVGLVPELSRADIANGR